MSIAFIETPIFTRIIKILLTDDELRNVQNELFEDLHKGDVIQGTGGLRKLRVASGKRSKGKRGGVRVIYYLRSEARVLFVYAYEKSKQDDLSSIQKKQLKQIAALFQKET